MKRIIVCLLGLLLLLGCQPTPDHEFVTNKSEGRMEELIEEDAVEAYDETQTLRALLGAPDTVHDSYTGHIWGGTLEVVLDAGVEIPDVSRIPVYTIAVNSESPEEIEALVQTLLGNGPYYAPNGALSAKHAYEREILHYNQWLEAYEQSAFSDSDQSAVVAEYYRDDRAYALSQLQKLEIGPMEPWTGSFSNAEVIRIANAQNDRVEWYREPDACYLEYRCGTIAGPQTEYMLTAPGTDAERQAVEIAEAFVNRIYAGNLKLIGAEHCMENGIDYDFGEYRVALMPVVNGIPVTPYYDNNTGSDTAKQAAGVEDNAARPVPHTWISVSIKDGTVTALTFRAPFFIRSTENDNVQLISFAQVLETFKTQIFRSFYMDAAQNGEQERTYRLQITGIELSYTVVRKADSDEFYLLPVWDFYGSAYDTRYPDLLGNPTSPNYRWWPIMTVNAIDGSILHRYSGY